MFWGFFWSPHGNYVELVKGLPRILNVFHTGFKDLGLKQKICVMPKPVKSTMQCRVCLEGELLVVFLYVCCCGVCAPGLNKCPVC